MLWRATRVAPSIVPAIGGEEVGDALDTSGRAGRPRKIMMYPLTSASAVAVAVAELGAAVEGGKEEGTSLGEM